MRILSTECWADIPGYAGLYQASDLGRVKSLSRPTPCSRGSRVIRERILRFQLGGTVGYPTVVIYKKGAPKTFAIHKLVMLAFVGPPPRGMEVCHWNGDPLDCALTNLRYATRKENRTDGLRLGEIPLGSNRASSKLTEADVSRLRDLVRKGERRIEVARIYGVSPMTIGKIVRRETWKHIA